MDLPWNTIPLVSWGKVSINFQIREISRDHFIFPYSKPHPLSPSSFTKRIHLDPADTIFFLTAADSPAPWTGTHKAFPRVFLSGGQFTLCSVRVSRALKFRGQWMKLNVANLHLQIDFVHMGVCTHLSGDKGFDSSWAMQ